MDQISEAFDLVKSVHQELDELIAQLTPEEKARRGSLQLWSAKDMLAHLAFWENHLDRQLASSLDGKEVPMAGDYYNQINDGVLLEHIDQPFEEARAEEAAAYEQFFVIVKGVYPSEMIDPQKFIFLQGHSLLERIINTFGNHPIIHISDYYVKNGRFPKARSLQEAITERLRVFPCWTANAVYNLACFYSLNGLKQEAIEKLKVAFQEKRSLIEWSLQDSDIDPLREMAEYQELIRK
jgi:tetratricopeptide (TPR) repeat protein